MALSFFNQALDMFQYEKYDVSDIFDNNETWPSRGIDMAHSPSQASVGCTREQWYSWISAPKTNGPPPRVMDLFDIGHEVEVQIGKHLKRKMIVLDTGFRFKTHYPGLDYPISGEMDFVLKDPDSPVPVPGDAKSASSKNFHGNDDGKIGVVDEPKASNALQLNLYMSILNAPHGWLFYYNKDDSEKLGWKINYSDEALEYTVQKFFELEKYLQPDNFVPPPRIEGAEVIPYKIKSKKGLVRKWMPWQCRWCDFRALCHQDTLDELDLVDEEATIPPEQAKELYQNRVNSVERLMQHMDTHA